MRSTSGTGPLIDGCSRALFALEATTTKLPIVAYFDIYEPVVQQTGFPCQTITDAGPEWMLIAFVCNLMQARQGITPQRRMHHVVEESKFNVRGPLPLNVRL